MVLPLDTVATDALEAGAQFPHLLNAAVMTATLQNGYAPT
jgi:hypothetical protein